MWRASWLQCRHPAASGRQSRVRACSGVAAARLQQRVFIPSAGAVLEKQGIDDLYVPHSPTLKPRVARAMALV